MSNMIKWKKPNGNEIETNDLPDTVKHCESLGWKTSKSKKKSDPKDPDKGE